MNVSTETVFEEVDALKVSIERNYSKEFPAPLVRTIQNLAELAFLRGVIVASKQEWDKH